MRDEITTAALVLTVSANAFAVLSLVARKAYRTFPVLFCYLCALLLQNTLGTVANPSSKIYEKVYNVSEPLIVLLSIFVVRELYRTAFANFPGISSLARWSTYAAALLTLLLCSVMIFATWAHTAFEALTGYVLFWERSVSFSLAVFISLMIFLLSRYPVDVPRSVVSNIIIFTLFFCGTFALSFPSTSHNLTAEWFAYYSIALLSTGCYCAWGFYIRPVPAERRVKIRAHLPEQDEEHLLQQLTALNRVLEKSKRSDLGKNRHRPDKD